jgi:hypothetical protein
MRQEHLPHLLQQLLQLLQQLSHRLQLLVLQQTQVLAVPTIMGWQLLRTQQMALVA